MMRLLFCAAFLCLSTEALAQHHHGGELNQLQTYYRIPHCGLTLPKDYDPYTAAENSARQSCCNGGDCCPRPAHVAGGMIFFSIDGKQQSIPLDDPRIIEYDFPLSQRERELKRRIPEHQALRTYLASRTSVCGFYTEHGFEVRCVIRVRTGF